METLTSSRDQEILDSPWPKSLPGDDSRAIPASVRALAWLLYKLRDVRFVGRVAQETLLDSSVRAESPYWQTRVEMEKAARQDFFSIFGTDDSVLKCTQVLDIGCGYGGNLLLWAERHPGTKFFGVEPSDHTIKVAGKARSQLGRDNVFVLPAMGEELPFEDGSFDLIMTFDVMEHVHDPRRVMREVARCLRPGGKYLGVFPPYFGPMSHHLTYITRMPFLHHLVKAEVLVAAVNHLIDSGRLQLHRQPEPDDGPWGRKTLPSLNGTTISDWNALSRELQRELPVTVNNTHLPFARRVPVLGGISRLMQKLLPSSDLFCGHILTEMRRNS